MDLPIGQAIIHLRHHRGLSQTQLAERMGCQRSFVAKAEHDEHSPLMDTFERFAIGLDIDAWKLLRYAEKLRNKVVPA